MDYTEAIDYLVKLTKFGFNFGLERIEELLRRLGNPHQSLKVIHVGGTNGKGSTSIMLSSILQAAGFKVGIFTSPHLHNYTERYRINGVEISKDRIANLLTRMKAVLDEMEVDGFEHPTEFEVGTAMAFLYFMEEQVDFLVLEVGLGGAIDSTNVITPLVSVITNVAMDHMDYLGNTIKDIATIKSGIIKKRGRVVTAAQNQEALEVIKEACIIKKASLLVVGQDITWDVTNSDMLSQSFGISSEKGVYSGLSIFLLGHHQIRNAATAVAVVELLNEIGYQINLENIRKGLAMARWPARLELVRKEPMVLLDGAHNYDGALSLKKALEQIFKFNKLVLVLGMLGDKERSKVVAELAPLANTIIITKPNNPRAGEWQLMAKEAEKYTDNVYTIENIHEAVNKGMSLMGQGDLLCVTGSLYMVAEARELFLK